MGSEFAMSGEESERRLLRLRASAQNYDWGRKGKDSVVAKLFALNSGSPVEPEKPYAELWMGTHESSPSFVIPGGVAETVTLKAWIRENPDALGEKVLERWGCDLPFLFKVLSVAKALSIQAHPDKDLARTLHKSLPNIYKDANHKPEMALAITQFEALCGFISLEELKDVLLNVPEIVELVGESDAHKFLHVNEHDEKEIVKSALKSLFTQLMSANKESVAETISKLKNRLHKVRELTEKEQLILRLEEQYPGDVGVISAFFFNYVKLNPGEAIYLGANEPHAYLSGECVECMATSDNVVRAGLTPKYRDVQTLCSMLTYKQGFPEILPGVHISPYIKRYLAPFDEFEVDHCSLPKGECAVFPAVSGPSIFLVAFGEGTAHTKSSEDGIKEGDILFAPANGEISMTTESELQVYRAGVNSRFLGDL